MGKIGLRFCVVLASLTLLTGCVRWTGAKQREAKREGRSVSPFFVPFVLRHTGGLACSGKCWAMVSTISRREAWSLFCHNTSNRTPNPGSVFS